MKYKKVELLKITLLGGNDVVKLDFENAEISFEGNQMIISSFNDEMDEAIHEIFSLNEIVKYKTYNYKN